MVKADLSKLDPRVAEYRRAHPASRAATAIVYARNSSAVRQERCILCGARGPTWSARWPKTKTAEAWADTHACPTEQQQVAS